MRECGCRAELLKWLKIYSPVALHGMHAKAFMIRKDENSWESNATEKAWYEGQRLTPDGRIYLIKGDVL